MEENILLTMHHRQPRGGPLGKEKYKSNTRGGSFGRGNYRNKARGAPLGKRKYKNKRLETKPNSAQTLP